MPRVWTDVEIIQVIENEIRAAYTHAHHHLGKTLTNHELAELVYLALKEHNLIQDEP